MSGVLNTATKGIYTDSNKNNWTYYQDQDETNIFYISPMPAFAYNGGVPLFHLTEYVDTNGNFVAGSCQITTNLIVPQEIISAVKEEIKKKGVANPQYQSMPFINIGNSNGENLAYLNYATADGTVSRSLDTVPSLSNNQQARFNIDYMDIREVQFFKDFFGGNRESGILKIAYNLTVWARMGGIMAKVHFDAKAAYEYQRTFKWIT